MDPTGTAGRAVGAAGTPDVPDRPGAPGAPDAVELAERLRGAIQALVPLVRGHTAHPDLTPSRLTALGVLDAAGRPLRIGELASRTGIALSTASRMVDLLADSGWIDRQPDPADQRACLIGLSAAGRAVLGAARRETTGALARKIARLDPDQRGVLRRALPALEALSRPGGEPAPDRR
ncbi:MarR family winged helix-turn-helix transcriptional regulator [Streptomyces subrutilus]|uniref:MarR family transcriptional regulator n=1 Tax=Streptomyces subrutilus TaxID=36818 RepID=A0A5P2UVS0_9ACTN|nr:MarR family transcriptional regulator [Streptomyces subrutilus]QEU82439.1 MarR family transcriptional regulator [Streptomyces subrutilus]WSJ28093.1 MarR family transcriptional regulator [Streptomyces subrutilus]GGZ70967.1 hypothetical protein GCM10010371_33720 [Streptomyces subrutilus]